MPIIDLYDDPKGSLLTNKVPFKNLPPVIKEGHILSVTERNDVPSRLFSLVMSDNGRHFRKFACPDAPNTAMSTFYFLENWKELPAPAVKTAAANLVTASNWYGLHTPQDLKKLAGIANVGIAAFFSPSLWKSGRKVSGKQLQSLGIRPKSVSKSLFSTKMSAAQLEPYVDVTGLPPIKEKIAALQKTAKPFTVQTPKDITKAIEMYREKRGAAHPLSKVAFCRPLVKRARLMGMHQDLPQEIRIYGSTKQASPGFIEAGILVRQEILNPKQFAKYVTKLSTITEHDPDLIAEKIASVDKEYFLDDYWGQQLPDPWFITRGLEKTGEYRFEENGIGVTGTQLHNLAKNGKDKLEKYFSHEFVKGFVDDPILIFKSMPLKQKKILISLANKRGTV